MRVDAPPERDAGSPKLSLSSVPTLDAVRGSSLMEEVSDETGGGGAEIRVIADKVTCAVSIVSFHLLSNSSVSRLILALLSRWASSAAATILLLAILPALLLGPRGLTFVPL